MVKSMTGYGRAVQTFENREIAVEIRSVHNRYLDCSVELPRVFGFAEDSVKAKVKQEISRGKVDEFISVNVTGTDKSASVLFFVLLMMDASADTDATDETENAYLRIVERTFAVFPEFGMDAQETSAAANLLYAGDAPEVGLLLLASGNLLKPSDGAPVTVPTQDMILGSYYLTTVRENDEGAGKVFRDENEALMAYAEHVITLHAPIKVRRTMTIDGVERTGLVDATAGRIIFNNPIPQNLGYVDRTDPEHWLEYEVSFRVTKKTLPEIISRCMTRNGTRKCAKMLDAIKAQGYKYSTLSAISVAV